ncbi:peptidoglycan recognition protein family protein [Agromyces larvae]|uniref:N-acetylmuramoyl-L-alanine amidase n=1 Tax=Agromyces larvae TaxID=2929802 RepID=A0ABY4C392_9MICO|nr:peptidoglycan recognition family protein [Agromyces larvae]UOE45464.1 N-acetylmuramoyl-L-alanine amidase [Agromyces larvae]
MVEFIIHHNAARGGAGVLEMMRTGSKQVSANYQVFEDGRAFGVVPREERSWSVSNAAWDGSAITFEIANNSGAPGWTISDASYDTVARIIAEDAAWAGIPINRSTVRGHREGCAFGHGGSYSTACPGGIDLDRLVRLAQQYQSSPAGGGTTPIQEDDMTPEQAKQLNAIYDALFKKDVVPGSTTGGRGMPGGLLRMAQIQYDATFQEEGKEAATRDGIFESLRKIRAKLGI